jgi:hypothetical protein
MKKIVLFSFLAFCTIKGFSQSAEIKPNQGISVPQFTTIFINSMTTQPKGTVVFDKDLNIMKYWDGSQWQSMSGGSSQWTTNGSDINNSNAGNVGIGTNTPLTKLQVEGTSIIATNTLIDPDTYPDKVISGRIADGTGWESIGIGGKNANPGQAWAIGSVNGDVSIAAGDGVNDNSLQTGLILDTQRNLLLTPFGGNVAVGVNASKAKFEVTSPHTTTALFGSTSTGISLQQNWPTVGFNQYRDASNVQRYIGDGYAFGNFMNPSTGIMAWHAIGTGTADNPTPTEVQAMTLDQYGQLKVNSLSAINPASQLGVGGSKLTAVSTGGSFSVGHGESSGGPFPLFTNYSLQMDGSRIQATSGLFSSSSTRLLLNPFGGNVGINTGSNAVNSTLFVVKTTNSIDGTAVFKGTTHFTHFHYGANEDTYVRGGKNGSHVILNDVLNGNVGIGVYPYTYKLEVNGTTRSKEVIVETGWADYVFEEDYKLKSIDELEAFVKENKHLPNIPKASEIESKGLKVGETNKAMMEKIEELALYIIQLKKEIDVLKSKN